MRGCIPTGIYTAFFANFSTVKQRSQRKEKESEVWRVFRGPYIGPTAIGLRPHFGIQQRKVYELDTRDIHVWQIGYCLYILTMNPLRSLK